LVLGLVTVVVSALVGAATRPFTSAANPCSVRRNGLLWRAQRSIPSTALYRAEGAHRGYLGSLRPAQRARRAALSRIAQKHGDFCICDLASFQVLSVVELDDASMTPPMPGAAMLW